MSDLAPRSLRAYTLKEAMALPPVSWLSTDLLTEGGLSMLVGSPGIGKTFAAIDLSMSVAYGKPWLGRETQQGRVVYIAAEGYRSVMRRMAAWCYYHSIVDLSDDLIIVPEAIDLLGGANEAERLLEAVGRLFPVGTEVYYGDEGEELTRPVEERPIRLIVVDTFARCVVGGDENAAEDMGKAIAFCDYLRRAMNLDETQDAHVMLIHHTNKAGLTERGSTALRGAVDTMLAIRRNRNEHKFNLDIVKQRDAEDGLSLPLALESVERLKTLVMVLKAVGSAETDTKLLMRGKGRITPRMEDILLVHLENHKDTGLTTAEIGNAARMSPNNSSTYRNRLIALDYLAMLEGAKTAITLPGIEYLMGFDLIPENMAPETRALLDAAYEARISLEEED